MTRRAKTEPETSTGIIRELFDALQFRTAQKFMNSRTVLRTSIASVDASRWRILWGNSEMPETIRTSNEKLRSRPRRRGFFSAAVFANLCVPFSAAEAGAEALNRAAGIFDRQKFTAERRNISP